MEGQGDGGLDVELKSLSSVTLKILMVQERIEEKLDTLLGRRSSSKGIMSPLSPKRSASPAKLQRIQARQSRPGNGDADLPSLEVESAVSCEWRSRNVSGPFAFKGDVQIRTVFERWFDELDGEDYFDDVDTDSMHADSGFLTRHSHYSNKITSQNGIFYGYIPIHPHSTFLVCWFVITALVLMAQLIYVPLDLAWDWSLSVAPSCLAAFWSLDACIHFLSGTYNADGKTNPIRVSARDYALSSFPFDIFLVVMDWISAFDVGGNGGVGLLRVGKVARAVRIMTILRMSKINRNVQRIMVIAPLAKRARMIFRVLYLCVAILWFLHLVACIWFLIGEVGLTDTGERWLDLPISMPDGTVMVVSTQRFQVQYAICFHWSVAAFTLGNMEVGYANTFERVFGIALTIMSFVFGSVIISLLSAIFLEHQNECMENAIKLRNVSRFLVENKVRNTLAFRIQKVCFERVNTRELLTFGETKALETLPASLYQELRYEIMGPFLNKHDLFHLWSIVNLSVAEEYSVDGVDILFMKPGDGLFKANAASDFAYFFSSGALSYSKSDCDYHSMVVTVPAGTWLSEAALWSHWRHVGTCEAQSRSKVAVASCERLVHHAQRYLTIRAITVSYCQFFCQGLALSRPPTAELPDDLRVSFTKFGELLAHFPNNLRTFIGTKAIQVSTFRTRNGWELQKEVDDGNCVAYIDINGELELAVVLMVLRLQNDHGQALYQVGKFVPTDVLNEFGEEERRYEVVPELKLPDLKRNPGELPEDTLRRLVETKISVVKDKFEQIGTCVEEEVCFSAELGVQTRYFRTKVIGCMRDVLTAKLVGNEISLGDATPWRPHNRLFIRENRFLSEGSLSHERSMSMQPQAMGAFGASKQWAMLKESGSLPKISLYVIFEGTEPFIYAWLSKRLADTLIGSPRRDRDELLTQLLCSVNVDNIESLQREEDESAHSLERFSM